MAQLHKTARLYDTNSYCEQFSARVLSAVPLEKDILLSENNIIKAQGAFRVVLDQTAFFPGGGGQACDKGFIGGLPVLYVYEQDNVIYHIVRGSLVAGTTVVSSIDWNYRFDNMQNHSGEHILSGIVHAEKGYDNVGFHLADTYTTVDFNGPLTDEEIIRMEDLTNQRIYDNLPIKVMHPYPDELKNMTYRSKKELSGDVRIVEVGSVDLCACCAPHVAHTGEVGIVKIIKHENYKGGVRLTILCGKRALAYFQNQNALIHRLCAEFSATPDNLDEALKKQTNHNASDKAQKDCLSRELIEARMALLSSVTSAQVLVETTLDEIACRRLAEGLSRQIGHAVCILMPKPTDDSEPEFRYILASSCDDLIMFTKVWNKTFNGRGGGSCEMTQGTVHGDLETLKKAFLSAMK